MRHLIHIQNVSKMRVPSQQILKNAAEIVLKKFLKQAEMGIRITNEQESEQLNATYRDKYKPTNVLAFSLKEGQSHYLGDLVLCAAVVKQEAKEQHKSLAMHFSHMIVHGTLHLLGFDHQKKADVVEMESLEVQFLKKLGFNNPYLEHKL